MSNRTFLTATVILAFVSLAWAGAPGQKPAATTSGAELKTDDEKTIYALGLVISDNLSQFGFSEAELGILKEGLTDGALKRPHQVDEKVYGPKIQDFAKARVTVASKAFLDKAAAEPGAVKKPSGLIYIEEKAGTGETPKATDKVRVHYTGTLADGTVFDSSVERGQPAEFPLNQVIPCWTEGVQLMKVGGKAKLVCPSEIAYGERGAGPKIRPGAALVFQVELLAIVPPEAPKPEAAKPETPAQEPNK